MERIARLETISEYHTKVLEANTRAVEKLNTTMTRTLSFTAGMAMAFSAVGTAVTFALNYLYHKIVP